MGNSRKLDMTGSNEIEITVGLNIYRVIVRLFTWN
jgi:hypothetical protein